jgi:hypothetical protein
MPKLKTCLRQWKEYIICLQETKLEFISSCVVRSF